MKKNKKVQTHRPTCEKVRIVSTKKCTCGVDSKEKKKNKKIASLLMHN
jgi:hypothetical protein